MFPVNILFDLARRNEPKKRTPEEEQSVRRYEEVELSRNRYDYWFKVNYKLMMPKTTMDYIHCQIKTLGIIKSISQVFYSTKIEGKITEHYLIFLPEIEDDCLYSKMINDFENKFSNTFSFKRKEKLYIFDKNWLDDKYVKIFER